MQYEMPSLFSVQRSQNSGPLKSHQNPQQRLGKANDPHLPRCRMSPPPLAGDHRHNDNKAGSRDHLGDRLPKTSDTQKSRR